MLKGPNKTNCSGKKPLHGDRDAYAIICEGGDREEIMEIRT